MQSETFMTILIADDNPPIRRIIRSLVAQESDKIYECSDGVEALAAYVKYRPDWVLMDIEMRNMDGIKATQAIRAVNPQARIIVVTSYDDPALRAATEEAGAIAYVVKDDLSQLRAAINEGTNSLFFS
jgi:two-component system NarL family response regulator